MVAAKGINLVSFPGGVPENVEDMELLLGEKKGSKRKRCVVGDLNGLSFKALDSGEAAAKHGLCKYGIVKVNTETKSVDVVHVTNVFAMRPQINDDEANSPARLAGMTPDERRKSLHEFGSSKKQRAVKQAASNQIQDATVEGASAVEKAILSATSFENAKEDEIALVEDAAEYALEQNRRLLLPTYDDKATEYSDAYPSNELISTALSDELDSFYETLLPADIGETKSKKVITMSAASLLSHFEGSLKGSITVITLLKTLELGYSEKIAESQSIALEAEPDGGTPAGTKMKKKAINREFRGKMVLLLHLHFILAFYKATTKATRGPSPKDQVIAALRSAPSLTADEYIKKFSHTTKREGSVMVNVPQFSRDKLMCHLIVLGMHLSMNRFDLTLLAQDLKSNEGHVGKYPRMLGMRTIKSKPEPGLTISINPSSSNNDSNGDTGSELDDVKGMNSTGGGGSGGGGGGGGGSHSYATLTVLPLIFPGPPRRAQKK